MYTLYHNHLYVTISENIYDMLYETLTLTTYEKASGQLGHFVFSFEFRLMLVLVSKDHIFCLLKFFFVDLCVVTQGNKKLFKRQVALDNIQTDLKTLWMLACYEIELLVD